MKRLILSIALLAAALLTIVFGGRRVLEVCDDMALHIEGSIDSCNGKGSADALFELMNFYSVFESNETMLNIFVRRELVEVMLSSAAAAKAYAQKDSKPDFISEAEKMLTAIEAIKSSYTRIL